MWSMWTPVSTDKSQSQKLANELNARHDEEMRGGVENLPSNVMDEANEIVIITDTNST